MTEYLIYRSGHLHCIINASAAETTLKMAEFFTTQKGEVRILNEQLDWQKFCKEVET